MGRQNLTDDYVALHHDSIKFLLQVEGRVKIILDAWNPDIRNCAQDSPAEGNAGWASGGVGRGEACGLVVDLGTADLEFSFRIVDGPDQKALSRGAVCR